MEDPRIDAEGVLTTWRDGAWRPLLHWEARRRSTLGAGFDWDDFNENTPGDDFWLACLRRFHGVLYKRRWLGQMDPARLPQ